MSTAVKKTQKSMLTPTKYTSFAEPSTKVTSVNRKTVEMAKGTDP